MDPIYVTGHRNPDTDSIVSAMAYAALCNAKIQFLLSRIEMLTMQSCRGKVLAFLLAEKREDGVILLRGTRDELASRLSVSHGSAAAGCFASAVAKYHARIILI